MRASSPVLGTSDAEGSGCTVVRLPPGGGIMRDGSDALVSSDEAQPRDATRGRQS
jgi:hypothetical protein